jgi:Mg2+ and Co2+ transporter CorA
MYVERERERERERDREGDRGREGEVDERWTNDRTPIWVDVQGMDDETMNESAEIFGLHPLTLEDWTVADTREKIEN